MPQHNLSAQGLERPLSDEVKTPTYESPNIFHEPDGTTYLRVEGEWHRVKSGAPEPLAPAKRQENKEVSRTKDAIKAIGVYSVLALLVSNLTVNAVRNVGPLLENTLGFGVVHADYSYHDPLSTTKYLIGKAETLISSGSHQTDDNGQDNSTPPKGATPSPQPTAPGSDQPAPVPTKNWNNGPVKWG